MKTAGNVRDTGYTGVELLQALRQNMKLMREMRETIGIKHVSPLP